MKKNPYPFSTIKDLMQKEVINKYDGSRMGYIKNFGIDLCSGRILSVILPAPCGGLFPKKEDEIIIPWSEIEKIGEDIILVRYPCDRIRDCTCKGEQQ